MFGAIFNYMKDSDLKWIQWAYGELGVKRTGVGSGNPRIIEYWSMFRMGGIQKESVSWCSAFVGAALESAGINTNSTDRSIYQIRTKDSSMYWLHWDGGMKCDPCYGCIAVMQRTGGGHVGFIVGQDEKNYILLGGNQGSAVSIAKFPKDRFVGFVMPKGNYLHLPIPEYENTAQVPTNVTLA